MLHYVNHQSSRDGYMQMRNSKTIGMAFVGCSILWISAAIYAAEKPAMDPAAVDQAFEALKTFDWGTDLDAVKAIDEAAVALHGDPAGRKELEKRLAAVLMTDVSDGAKQYVCRKLMLIGTGESVPALGALLTHEKLSHMARYALERNPAPEAAAALREALPNVKGLLKVGVIGSLGARRDAASGPKLAALLNDADMSIACAAAGALGKIGNSEAAQALRAIALDLRLSPILRSAATDALLVCAEQLLADGQTAEAASIYRTLGHRVHPKKTR